MTFANVFDGFKFFFSLALAAFATLIIKMLGFAFLIVPGIYAVGVLTFVPLVIVDQGVGPFDAMRISYEALKTNWLAMFGLAFVSALLSYLGLLACCIGGIFTTPIYYLAIALHYHAFFPPKNDWQQAPIGP